MKVLKIIFLCIIPLLSWAQEKVSIHITYINSYCGGAKPTPEIEEKYNTPQNFSNCEVKLFNKKGLLIKTDSLGVFLGKLHPGKYVIFLTAKKNNSLFTNYNPACLKMLKASYGEITIVKEKKNYEINLFFPCNPCEKNDKP